MTAVESMSIWLCELRATCFLPVLSRTNKCPLSLQKTHFQRIPLPRQAFEHPQPASSLLWFLSRMTNAPSLVASIFEFDPFSLSYHMNSTFSCVLCRYGCTCNNFPKINFQVLSYYTFIYICIFSFWLSITVFGHFFRYRYVSDSQQSREPGGH